MIKLSDRLHYVLQPSLESLLARGSLEFPLQPFPYQFQGVAFLYPRLAAILADEMGLGKTMQAITAMRLLLHAGEIGSVLLVCPKPLVTNWQREFALWAPEVPVSVIEGDPQRRAWQWQLPTLPGENRQLRIAVPRSETDWRRCDCISTWSCSTNRSESRTAAATSDSRLRDSSQPQLGADRHAGRKHAGRPGGHFRVPRPRPSVAGDEAASDGPRTSATTSCGARRTRCSPTCRRSCSAMPKSS